MPFCTALEATRVVWVAKSYDKAHLCQSDLLVSDSRIALYPPHPPLLALTESAGADSAPAHITFPRKGRPSTNKIMASLSKLMGTKHLTLCTLPRIAGPRQNMHFPQPVPSTSGRSTEVHSHCPPRAEQSKRSAVGKGSLYDNAVA